jgi:amidase
MDEIWRWSATRIAAAIRKREISAKDALEACLARMSAVNPKLNAVTVDLSDAARAAAERADRAVANGDALGPLHGVPVTIKENVDQEGSATTNGVVGFQNIIAKADSPIVANWKRAGAIIVGRTNTPAFSFRLDTVNDLRGRTYNPWSKTRTPGGSSGGAASSVAAGITPLAHGNDIAGSVRFPAYASRRAVDVVAIDVGARSDRALRRRCAPRSRRDGCARSARSMVDAGATRRGGAA